MKLLLLKTTTSFLGFLFVVLFLYPNLAVAASVDASWASSEYLTSQFTVTWRNADYYQQYNNGWSAWTALPSKKGSINTTGQGMGWSPGWHGFYVAGWNGSNWDTSQTSWVYMYDTPIPSTPIVYVVPTGSIGLNQIISVSWPTSGATSYNYKVDGTTITTISNTATSVSGTPLYFGFTTSGSHKVEVQACNVTGCSSYGRADFSLTTAPTITTFTTTNGVLSLQVGGGPVTLSWSSINTTKCIASNGWSGIKPTSGSETISVTSTATYDLTCQ